MNGNQRRQTLLAHITKLCRDYNLQLHWKEHNAMTTSWRIQAQGLAPRLVWCWWEGTPVEDCVPDMCIRIGEDVQYYHSRDDVGVWSDVILNGFPKES